VTRGNGKDYFEIVRVLQTALIALTVAQLAGAQTGSSRASTYTHDISGNRVEDSRSTATKQGGVVYSSQTVETINGRRRPTEEVTERLVQESGGVRILERLVKRYDQNGTPGSPEKQVIEERRAADGSSTTNTTVYRGDLNGRMALAERSITQERRSGTQISSETTLERPTLNGSLQVAERRSLIGTETPNRTDTDVTTYRPDVSGRFVPTQREVSRTVVEAGQTKESTAQYQATSGGQLGLFRQTEAEITPTPGGGQTKSVNVYTTAIPGSAQMESQPLRLREQQLYETRKEGGDRAVETFKVRRPDPNNPRALGAYRVVSETVCTGDCISRPAAPAKTAAPAKAPAPAAPKK
jgi:hypothetical protein